MPRQKTMSTEKMIELFDEFHAQYPRTKYKTSIFGKYLREKGYEVSDKSIRRNEEFREYVNSVMNSKQEELNDTVVFVTLDTEEFINHNNTKDKMKEALAIRDQYYANVAASANASIQKRKEYETMLETAEERNRLLEEKCRMLQERLENEKEHSNKQAEKIEKANEIIGKMIDLIEGYVYPEVANTFLQKEGIIDYLTSPLPEIAVDQRTVTLNDEIGAEAEGEYDPETGVVSSFASVNDLLGGFEDDGV